MLSRRTLLHTTAVLAGAALLYKLLGFSEKILLAAFFGTSADTDAYLAGAAVVALIAYLLQDVAGPALIPVFIASRERAAQVLAATQGLVLLMIVPLTLLAWWGAPTLAWIFGPGFDAPTLALTARVIRIGLLALPLLSISALLIAGYQARDQFFRPAFCDLMLKIGPLIGIVVTGNIIGAVWGLTIGAVVRWVLLHLLQRPVWPQVGHDAALPTILRTAWPLMATALVSTHLITVIETALASTLAVGAVSALAYARRIVDVPVLLAPQIVGRVIFPGLAALVVAQDRAGLQRALRRTLRLSLLTLMPLAAVGVVLATPIVRVLLERGAFDAGSVGPTSVALFAMLPGLPALGLGTLLVRFNYAAGDTRRPSLIRVAGAVLQIGLAVWWRRWGLAGLGWATTVSLWAETVALYVVARHTVGRGGAATERSFWVALAMACGMAAAVVAWSQTLVAAPDGTLALLSYLVGLSSLGFAVYGACLLLLRVHEVRSVLLLMRRSWLGRAREA